MRIKRSWSGLALVGVLSISVSHAERYDRPYDQPYGESGYGTAAPLEERVARLEKRLSGNTLIEMSNQIDKLQAETQKLRGRVEELGYALEKAKKQWKADVQELEERLVRATTPTPVPVPTVTPIVIPAMPTATPAAPGAPGSVPGDPAAPAPVVPGTAPAPQSTLPAPVVPAAPTAGTTAPEPAIPAPTPTPTPVDPVQRQNAYEKAFGTLKEGRYNDAIREFKNFIAVYPTGEFADSAHFWLAEAYYVNRDYASARDNFRKMVTDFPQSAKVADAQLKLGLIEYDVGQYAAAREILTDVIKRYPDSSAAKLAEKRLERMRLEKR